MADFHFYTDTLNRVSSVLDTYISSTSSSIVGGFAGVATTLITIYVMLWGWSMMRGVINPALRQYLPADYQTILNNGYGNWAQIRAASKLVGIENTSLNAGSDAGQAFEAGAKQAALNPSRYTQVPPHLGYAANLIA